MNDQLSEINAIAQRLAPRVDSQALENLRARAIGGSMSVETFREAALALLPALRPVGDAPRLDYSAKDLKNYSLSRAIMGQIDKSINDGFEREISRNEELAGRGRPEGILVPDQCFTRNMVAGTGTLGGFAVQTDNVASEFVKLLRNKSQVIALGAKVLNLSRQCTIPRQNGAATANWLAETAASTLSGINLTQLTLTPQAVGAQVQYSKLLLMESDPSIDGMLREDIMEILGLAIDLAAIHGTGSGQPTGILNTAGIGSVALATNGLSLANTTAFSAMVSLENILAASNADQGAVSYLMRSNVRGQLKTQSRFANTDTPVYSTKPDGSGTVNGYNAATSNQISAALTTGTATTICTPVIMANWADLIVANFGSTDLVVDPYSKGSQGIVALYARRFCDVGLRRPQSVAALFGVLGG